MNKISVYFVMASALTCHSLWAQQGTTIIGKNDWLFYQYEMTDPSYSNLENTSLDLIAKFNRQLRANGINLVVTLVPLKMRVYSEHLPDSIKLSEYMIGSYARMSGVLASAQVHLADLNTVFLASQSRNSDAPFFFRLDSHWAPAGAMLAAETIKSSIDANSELKKTLNALPVEKFNIIYGKRKRPSKGRDLAEQLPTGSPNFAAEMVTPVNISRAQPPKEDLLGNRLPVGITLVGSSYSHEWTGFPDALRYVLQRDVLGVSVGADRGSRVGMESYLRDDSFQTKAPEILLWELPERDMKAPPDYKFRDARYVTNNTEWLLRVSALVQAKCEIAEPQARVVATGLGSKSGQLKGNDLVAGPTVDGDFVEISFDKPLEKLDYLSARLTLDGPKLVTLEGSGAGVASRQLVYPVAGDDASHVFKVTVPSATKGFSKVRIFPGKSNGFALQNLQVCRQPAELLK